MPRKNGNGNNVTWRFVGISLVSIIFSFSLSVAGFIIHQLYTNQGTSVKLSNSVIQLTQIVKDLQKSIQEGRNIQHNTDMINENTKEIKNNHTDIQWLYSKHGDRIAEVIK